MAALVAIPSPLPSYSVFWYALSLPTPHPPVPYVHPVTETTPKISANTILLRTCKKAKACGQEVRINCPAYLVLLFLTPFPCIFACPQKWQLCIACA